MQIYPPRQFSKYFASKMRVSLFFIVYYVTNTLQIYLLNFVFPNILQSFFLIKYYTYVYFTHTII